MTDCDRVAAIEARLSAFLEAVPEGVSIESAAVFELTMAWQRIVALEAALTPFAEVGAAVAARPAYPPTQTIMRVGEASFTVAHLAMAAVVLTVRAEAVTGGGSGKGGISEHGEKAT